MRGSVTGATTGAGRALFPTGQRSAEPTAAARSRLRRVLPGRRARPPALTRRAHDHTVVAADRRRARRVPLVRPAGVARRRDRRLRGECTAR